MKLRAGYLTYACALVLVLCLFPGCVSAQVTTATLYGGVADPSGAVVPQATVTITNLGTNISSNVATSGAGEYRFDLVPVGTYSVIVSAKGYKKFVQASVALTVNEQQRLDITLSVGAVDQTVTVSGAPPQVDLEGATGAATLGTREVDNLPVLNRNIYNLLTTIPGVQNNTVGGNTLGFNQQVVQMNGGTIGGTQAYGTVSYYLDGGLNMTALRDTGNDMPNPEALDEFNVQTNNYDATYGKMSSGVISALTKSGGNAFHGAFYEFNRNTDFDASNSIIQGGGIGIVHRNMYGVTAGGPIRHDKTFFFAEFGGVRQVQPKNLSGAVLPTFTGGTTGTGEAGGDFSQFLPSATTPATAACGGMATAFVVCNPATHKPYVGPNGYASNIITDPLDPTAVNIMKYLKGFENSTVTSGGIALPSFTGQQAQRYDTYELMGKIDEQLTPKQRLEGTYFYVNGNQQITAGSPNVPWVQQSQIWTQQVTNLSDTLTISPSKINQAWFTWTRVIGGRENLSNAGQGRESLAAFGSKFAIQGPPSLSQITTTGYFVLGNTIDGPKAGTNFYSARDLFILTKGENSLKMGGEFALNKDVQLTDLDNYGVLAFVASTSARTGNALSDFVLGQLNSTEQDSPVYATDNSFFYALFAQDDWRLRPNLTINLGARWDIQTPPTDPENKESAFVPDQQSVVNPTMPLGLLVVGDKGITRGTVATPFSHFSPRAGLAWDPFGDGKTSIRAGAGIFWGSVSGNQWNTTSNYYPFAQRYTFPVPGTLTNPYLNTPNIFPFTYTPGKVQAMSSGATVEGNSLGFKWPTTYQLTATIQRQISSSLAVSVGYVGSLGRHIQFTLDNNYPIFNTANPASNTTGASVLARRPYDTGALTGVYGPIFSSNSTETSNYNSLQFTFSQRTSKGISFNGFYTFSKNLDSNNLNSNAAPVDYNNPKIEKGHEDFDQRHVFSASVVWEPNYFHGDSRAVQSVLDGWHLSGIVSLHTGNPFNITTGSDNNQDGNTTDRPVLLHNPLSTGTNRSSRSVLAKEFFNPSFVTGSVPTTQTFCGYSTKAPGDCVGVGPGGSDGSMSRNQLYGPGFRNVDASLFRDFALWESIKLQARAEASNVFNLVSLGAPNGTLSSSTAGQITSQAGNMREIQLGLRLTY